jgi:hypothetical protein
MPKLSSPANRVAAMTIPGCTRTRLKRFRGSGGVLVLPQRSWFHFGQAISYFFAIAQIVGSMGPLIFANFVGNGTDRVPLFWGYVLGSGVMIFGGVATWFFGVNAEGRGLEDIAAPLTSVKTAVA